MKRIYAALAIIAVLLFCGYIERRCAFEAADKTLEAVEKAELFAEHSKLDMTELYCKQAGKIWSENRTALELFLPHNDLDSAALLVDKVIIYAHSGDGTNVKIYIAELKNRLESFKEAEKIDVYNLF